RHTLPHSRSGSLFSTLPQTSGTYTLSLHDALPISNGASSAAHRPRRRRRRLCGTLEPSHTRETRAEEARPYVGPMALVFPFVLAVVAAATLLLAPAGGPPTPASTAVDGSDATAEPREPSGHVPVDQMPVSDGRGTVITVPQDAVEHAPVTAEPDPELAAAGAAATPPAPADVPSRTDPGSPAAASEPTDPAYVPVYFMPVEGVSV